MHGEKDMKQKKRNIRIEGLNEEKYTERKIDLKERKGGKIN